MYVRVGGQVYERLDGRVEPNLAPPPRQPTVKPPSPEMLQAMANSKGKGKGKAPEAKPPPMRPTPPTTAPPPARGKAMPTYDPEARERTPKVKA